MLPGRPRVFALTVPLATVSLISDRTSRREVVANFPAPVAPKSFITKLKVTFNSIVWSKKIFYMSASEYCNEYCKRLSLSFREPASGRRPPPDPGDGEGSDRWVDPAETFHFGFARGGIYEGWPPGTRTDQPPVSNSSLSSLPLAPS